MSYYATHQIQSFSPFDEALERQKQPFLDETQDDEQTKTLSNNNASSFITQFVCSLITSQNNQNPTKQTSSEILPYWSTKYREHKNYRDDDDETMMIETIDFVHSGTTEIETSKEDCCSVDELHMMNFKAGTNIMTLSKSNRHQYVKLLVHRQQEEQRRKLIIGIVALIVATMVSIVFVGTFIFT
jgi:hypothetical protein